MSTVAHVCHARGCQTVVPRRMFMCRRHWFALPTDMRAEIWASYAEGQEERMDPSREYLAAAQRCIDYLAEREQSSQERML